MRKNNFNDLNHAFHKRSRNADSKTRAKVKHSCPECGRMHWCLTDLCYQCKVKDSHGNYEIVFNTEVEKEMFEYKAALYRMEERLLKDKGYDPNRINSAVADRILERI